ncbi:MAG: alpha/beta hydrolase [Pirellulales bacterium]
MMCKTRNPLRRTVCPALALAMLGGVLCRAADQPPELPVWPAAAPGETGKIEAEKYLEDTGGKPVKRLTNVSRPMLTVYKPSKEIDTGAAVLICPGGGYHILAMDLEGEEVAAWLNSIGVTGIVLKYRVPRRENLPKHAAPLQDAQRAMSIVRGHASEWGIAPARIGILGFSAGGHLAATACTNFGQRRYEAIDDIDKVSCRPDFAVLIYPAYLVEEGQLQPEVPVTAETPPVFFVHAGDDGISPENSIGMYLALKKAGVPSELHVYASGGHGFGLRPSEHPASQWPDRCAAWLKSRKLLERPAAE